MTDSPRDQPVFSKLESFRDWHAYLLICVVGFVLYIKTVLFSFTFCDDYRLIVMNGDLLSHLSNIPKFFTKDVFVSVPNPYLYLRPLLNISFMLDAQIGGEAPGFFHFTNIILHIGCSLLVFILFKKLYSDRVVATSAALIFSVHPLLTYAVAWIPGRNDSLFTLFVLSSFVFFLRMLEGKRVINGCFHVLFLALALLTKETAVILPIMLLLYVIMVRSETREWKPTLTLVVAWTVMLGSWLYIRSNVPQNFVVNQPIKELVSFWLSRLPALLLYFGKIIFPFNLSVFPNLQDNNLWWGMAAVGFSVLVLLLVPGEKNYRAMAWGIIWFVLFLVPSFVAGAYLPEHRAYISFVGFLVAIYQFPCLRQLRQQKIFGLSLFVSALLLLGVIAFLHSDNFRDREAFCKNAIEKSPSIENSYISLAGMYIDEEQYDPAEK